MTRILQFAGATEKLRSIQLWATASVLVSAPLFFGSVDQFWIAVWIVVLSITTILGVSRPLNIVQVRVVWAFLSVCLIYAIVAVIQVAPQLLVRDRRQSLEQPQEVQAGEQALDDIRRVALAAHCRAVVFKCRSQTALSLGRQAPAGPS